MSPDFWRGFWSVWGHPMNVGFWLGMSLMYAMLWIFGRLA